MPILKIITPEVTLTRTHQQQMLFWKHEGSLLQSKTDSVTSHLWKYMAWSTWMVATTLSTPKLTYMSQSKLPNHPHFPTLKLSQYLPTQQLAKPGARSVDFFLEAGCEHTDFAKHSLCCSYQLCPLRHRTATDDTAGQAACLQKMRAMGWRWGLEAPEATKASAEAPWNCHTHPTYRLHMIDSAVKCIYVLFI